MVRLGVCVKNQKIGPFVDMREVALECVVLGDVHNLTIVLGALERRHADRLLAVLELGDVQHHHARGGGGAARGDATMTTTTGVGDRRAPLPIAPIAPITSTPHRDRRRSASITAEFAVSVLVHRRDFVSFCISGSLRPHERPRSRVRE